ncbi:MAG: gamma carbonic anhydrase family protein [Lachnospiraceae bacterium]|nr:gamma carbonic anhydrase family protein [Lachnospiraceae bacterium]
MKIHESAYIADGAVVLGEVSIGEDCSVWFNSTVRADRASIVMGKGSNIQDNAVVHVDEGFPVYIGDNVTIGHGAIVHGCEIQDNTLVGMGAIILNGAKIGKNCMIGAGALVTQNAQIPDNSLVVGCPGKVLRQVTEAEIASNLHNATEYVEEGKKYKAAQ